ncbi:hypothetical protein O6H91_22G016800 [Diphasiastrum complanatum]|uniref:Uncharacterized protein n=1 Tax=Diphasiastrum complanatum TaxID=34168 RepID=A0ACC2ADC8_DIPCM|nr:hypothetical protein O6H91_22G016800 [Diphasiastrum complanatum]
MVQSPPNAPPGSPDSQSDVPPYYYDDNDDEAAAAAINVGVDLFSTVVIHDPPSQQAEETFSRRSSEAEYEESVYRRIGSSPDMDMAQQSGAGNAAANELVDIFSTVVVRETTDATSAFAETSDRNIRNARDHHRAAKSITNTKGYGEFRTFGRKGLAESLRREVPKVPFRDDSGVVLSSTLIHKGAGDRDSFSTVKERGSTLSKKRGNSAKQSDEMESEGRGRGELSAAQEPTSLARHPRRKSSPVHENVIREDPSLKYELLNELGKGSYGAVYKARDLKTSELVAIKVISLSQGEEGYDEIRGEIEMLQQCNHPNVVRYLGSYQGEDYLWIVMEYCGGGSVADLMSITDEALEEHQIAYICKEALKGLSYLHSIFKVHRDIKGGNILLTEQGEVKLGDFGVAAQLTRTMSKRNTFIGTPHWMAPEVIQESRYDGKVDVWALGVSAIEMAEGLPPRSNVHPMRVLFMISREPAPMLEDKEKWSLIFHDFVAKCLTKEPRSRPTATAMLQHKFIEKCKGTAGAMLPKIEKARAVRLEMVSRYVPEQGTASSGNGQWSWEKGQTVKMHDTFGGTVLVRHANDSPEHNENRSAVKPEDDDFEGEFGTVVVHETKSFPKKESGSLGLGSPSVADTSGTNDGLSNHNLIQSSKLSPAESPSLIIEKASPGHETSTKDLATVEYHQQLTPIQPPVFSPSISPTTSPIQQPRDGDLRTTLKRSPVENRGAIVGTPKNAATLRPGFALHDKLLSVYAAGNTVPIPFIKATDISPIALLSDDITREGRPDNGGAVIALEAVQEICHGGAWSDGQIRKGKKMPSSETPLPPSVYQRLASSSTLSNVARALAYHKMSVSYLHLRPTMSTAFSLPVSFSIADFDILTRCYEEMPLQGGQAIQEQQIIQNLSDTLRTILRL